jgi:hypothetical protein
VRDRALWLVDALPPRGAASRPFEALWHIPDLPGTVLALQRTSTSLALLLAGQGRNGIEDFQVWCLSLPDLTLRSRESVFESRKGEIALGAAIASNGCAALVTPQANDRPPIPALTIEFAGTTSTTTLWNGFPELALSSQDCFLTRKTPEGIELDCLKINGATQKGFIQLPGAAQCKLRIDGRALTVADDRGRAIALDPKELKRMGSVRV